MDTKTRYTHDEWVAEAIKRFGEDSAKWKFKCPSCGCITAIQEWIEVDAKASAGFSCIGRFNGSKKTLGDKTGGPCNYAGFGLFRLNPVVVTYEGEEFEVFEFAEASNG